VHLNRRTALLLKTTPTGSTEYEEELGCQPGFLFFGRAIGGYPIHAVELNSSTL